MSSRVEEHLKRLFQHRGERIEQALEQSRQERSRIHDAAKRYQDAAQELPKVRARLGQLPAEHSAATLRRDQESQDRIQAEHDRLIEREGQLEAERDKAAGEMEADPFTAESLSLQRVQRLADSELREAKKERDELVRVLDESINELEAQSREAAALRPTFLRTEREAS